MSESATSLSAAATDRKARLAQLKSLKRKQPPADEPLAPVNEDTTAEVLDDQPLPTTKLAYVSGRNYDPETRGPRLGFENAPVLGQSTLEAQAKELASTTKRQAEEEEKADKPLDLFKLQPKKPNWDLKRDLDKKLEVLNVRTDNAIARMVRERIQNANAAATAKQQDHNGSAAGEAVGMDGNELVEAMHMREREEEEEERREREEERRDLGAGAEEEEDDDDDER